MAFSIEVQTDPSFAARVDVEWVQEVVREVLRGVNPMDRVSLSPQQIGDAQSEALGTGQLTVLVTGDDRVRELNRRYRGVDSTTDVLAFGGTAAGFVESPGTPGYLGDVVVSYHRVLAQSAERGHSPDRELALLVIHGALHLLGYDHTTVEEEAIMWAQQEAILRRVGYSWRVEGAVSRSRPGD
jgi:probable rRNA maturation factor